MCTRSTLCSSLCYRWGLRAPELLCLAFAAANLACASYLAPRSRATFLLLRQTYAFVGWDWRWMSCAILTQAWCKALERTANLYMTLEPEEPLSTTLSRVFSSKSVGGQPGPLRKRNYAGADLPFAPQEQAEAYIKQPEGTLEL